MIGPGLSSLLALPRPPPGGPRATAVVLAFFLVAYFTLKTGSYAHRSATYDEPIHLAAGYAALAQQDYRVDPTHPPLLRMWAALPLLTQETTPLDPARIDRQKPQDWIHDAYKAALDFLYKGSHADRNLNLARCMIILLGAAMGLTLYAWAREWLGFYPALLVLLFYLVEPNLAAHATLVTTDFGLTFFFFGTFYFFWRTQRNFSGGNLAGLALFFALANVSKFSAVLLVPAGALLLGLAVWRRHLTPRRAAIIAGLLFISAYVTIWAVYGFRYAPSDTPGWLFRFDETAAGFAAPPLVTPFLQWVDARHLLPNAYTQGFLLGVGLAHPLPGYLAGTLSRTGWWYYFPAVFLLKTPLALVILLGTGLVVIAVRRRALGVMNSLHLLLPAGVFLAAAMASNITLGLRHILPIYPFVLLIAATVGWELRTRPRPSRTLAAGLGLVLAFWMVTFFRVYPYNLTYISILVGGPGNGAKYLVDSNLDWGQHQKLLKQWMTAHGVDRINLAYFGMADPEYHGIDYVALPGTWNFSREHFPPPELPGYVAISATVQSGVYYRPEWRLFYSGFRRLVPRAVIGNTINVYWVERWPEPVADAPAVAGQPFLDTQRTLADALVRLEWPELARQQYELYLPQRPGDSAAWVGLGSALAQLDRDDEALAALHRAVAVDPSAGDARVALVSLLLHENQFAPAIAAVRDWVALDPANAGAHELLGIALATANQMEEARAAFSRAAELDPANPSIQEHLRQAGAGQSN